MLKLTSLALASSLAFTAFANAKDGFYGSLSGGMTSSSNIQVNKTKSTTEKLKSGTPLSFGVGYNYQNFSFELAYTTLNSKFKNQEHGHHAGEAHIDSEVKSEYLFANTAYNFATVHPKITPYAGFGVGLGMHELAGEEPTDFKDTLSYQFIAGAKYNVNNNVQLFADVRYIEGFSNAKAKSHGTHINSITAQPKYYSVNFGANYLFQ